VSAPTAQCSVCAKAVPRGRLMCVAHWRAVPLQMQRDVWRTWGAFQNRQGPHHALRLLNEYRQAADAATGCVRALSNPEAQEIPS